MTNKLEKNLELRQALAEVDRLTSENVELKNKIDELEDKYRGLKLRITNQVALFQMGSQSPYEMARIIKEILK